jgi:hypothetical protein
VVEYYVKWKGLSFMHCQWVPETVLARDRVGLTKLQTFLRKWVKFEEKGVGSPVPRSVEEAVPESWVDVERIVAQEAVPRDAWAPGTVVEAKWGDAKKLWYLGNIVKVSECRAPHDSTCLVSWLVD